LKTQFLEQQAVEMKETLDCNDSAISDLQKINNQLENEQNQDLVDVSELDFDYFLQHLYPRKYAKVQNSDGKWNMNDTKRRTV
jgi:site-specific recombinase XerD